MDIYSILKNDHEEVKSLLNELIALDEEDSYRGVLVTQIEQALVPHARAEESVFYNSIRALSDQSEVMHSYKEHMEAETLLRGLQFKEGVKMDWKSTAIKLKEALEHHIQEEENKIFAEARKIFSDDDARMMGEAFVSMKEQVANQGFLKNSFDMVVNLMPPRFVDKIRSLGDSNPS